MVFHFARLKLTSVDIDINGPKWFEYLGLMVEQKLKWIDHIAHVKLKVAHVLGIITNAKPL